jgi:hypothetical protein
MTDRERLADYIGAFCKGELGANFNKDILEKFADHILADAWMRPPCQVGDVVWYLNKHPHIALFQNSVYKARVVRLVTISTGTVIVIQIISEGCCEIPDESDWGITLFASREEAEKAMMGGESDA